ncbi:MAG TPA: CHAT domain-containing protein [Candidatus Limnocylindrales bacterium]|nr:CHAT domain-containing protein [Candidatus Limnocylindrales bacterium]
MASPNLFALVLAVTTAFAPASGQVPGSSASGEGVIVESVAHGGGAEAAGLRQGDIILAWSGVQAGGRIASPYDVTWLETEQAPRGPVILDGRRGAEALVWRITLDDWGIKVRPPFPERLADPYNRGAALARTGKLKEAAQAWNQAAEGVTADDPPWLKSWFFAHAAEMLSEAGQLKDADGYYQRAIQNCPPNEPSTMAGLLWSRGYFLLKQAEWAKAQQAFESSLQQARQVNPQGLAAANALEYLGLAAFFQDDLATGRDHLQRALDIQEEFAPGSAPLASSLVWLGAVEMTAGDVTSAEHREQRAVEIDEKIAPLGTELAEAYNILGRIESARGDLARAEESFRHTLSIGEKIGPNPMGKAAMLINIATIAQERGDLTRAADEFQKAMGIAEKIDPSSPVVAAALNNLGLVASDAGDFPAAQRYFDRALLIRKKRNPRGAEVASTLVGLGRLASRRGDTEQAREYFEQAQALQQGVAPLSSAAAGVLASLAELALKNSDLPKAEGYYRRAQAIFDRIAPESAGEAEVLAGLASIDVREGRTEEAAQLYRRAMNALESQIARFGGSPENRSGFRARHDEIYRDYSGLLVRQKEFERGFEALERSRARMLLEMLATAHADIRKGVAPALLQKERGLQADIRAKSERRIRLLGDEHSEPRLKSIEKEISSLVSEYQEVEADIRSASPGYAELTQPQPMTAKQIQHQLLDSNTLLLEYSLGEQRSYLFAVGADSLRAFELPGRRRIESVARRLHQQLTARTSMMPDDKRVSGHGKQSSAAALSRMVLGPVAAQLKDKRLLIVADGVLEYIPFALLPEPASPAHPLLMRHEIVNLPSASVLGALRREQARRKAAPKYAIVFADPVFDKQDPRVSHAELPQRQSVALATGADTGPAASSDSVSAGLLTRSAGDLGLSHEGAVHLPRLRFTRREADAIRAVTPPGGTKAELDFDATRAMATSPQLGQYRIVHFATHGLINSEHPELSGLVFSLVDRHGNPQDGFLQLQDIYNLNLPADLVVLSACETALGKEINGEGMVGLTRGFMYAGASRVVASLWNVSDVATAQLMTRFYSAMEKDRLTPAAALRKAQISMLRQDRWHSPYYWAAFQIYGEWR